MTVFDVGANIGDLALLYSRLVGSGVVHAFEPASQPFARLARTLADNRATNVKLNRVALTDVPGVARLYCYDGLFHAFSSMAERPLSAYGVDAGPVRQETVPATTIDGYCAAAGISSIDLLKIDVEGAELQVLRGASDMLSGQRIGCVAFEFGQTTFDMGNDPREILSLFDRYGYRLTNLVRGARLFPGGKGAATARFAMHLAMPR